MRVLGVYEIKLWTPINVDILFWFTHVLYTRWVGRLKYVETHNTNECACVVSCDGGKTGACVNAPTKRVN